MSTDYRPRGGSGTGGSSGGDSRGPRRRRGGRNRGGAGRSSSGDSRGYNSTRDDNGHANGNSSAPAKKESPIAKLFGWLTGKKKTPETKSSSIRTPIAPRPENRNRPDRQDRPREPRPPRTDRPARPDMPREDLPAQEIVSPKLYVGNLAYEAVESDLYDLFAKIGSVKNVEVAMDRQSQRSKGFGFVEMDSLDIAKEAAEKLNRTDFMGRQIVVSGAKMERSSVNNRDAEATPPEVSSTEDSV